MNTTLEAPPVLWARRTAASRLSLTRSEALRLLHLCAASTLPIDGQEEALFAKLRQFLAAGPEG